MTRKSKPRRSCKICKFYKYMGNNPDRRPGRDLRRLQDDPAISRNRDRERHNSEEAHHLRSR